jgi:hypothetical protein
VPFATGRVATGLRWEAIGPESLHACRPAESAINLTVTQLSSRFRQELSLSYRMLVRYSADYALGLRSQPSAPPAV